MRTLLLVLLCGGVCIAQAPAAPADVTVASGRLAHHYFTNDLFRIDELWMQVTPDTVFHRWLDDGVNDKAEVTLTTHPEKFGDRPNIRILTGRLSHQTDPSQSPIVHMMFLHDQATGTIGAVTFETDDQATAQKFDGFEAGDVSIVIEIK